MRLSTCSFALDNAYYSWKYMGWFLAVVVKLVEVLARDVLH